MLYDTLAIIYRYVSKIDVTDVIPTLKQLGPAVLGRANGIALHNIDTDQRGKDVPYTFTSQLLSSPPPTSESGSSA